MESTLPVRRPLDYKRACRHRSNQTAAPVPTLPVEPISAERVDPRIGDSSDEMAATKWRHLRACRVDIDCRTECVGAVSRQLLGYAIRQGGAVAILNPDYLALLLGKGGIQYQCQ